MNVVLIHFVLSTPLDINFAKLSELLHNYSMMDHKKYEVSHCNGRYTGYAPSQMYVQHRINRSTSKMPQEDLVVVILDSALKFHKKT
jgi:hypothetical protein